MARISTIFLIEFIVVFLFPLISSGQKLTTKLADKAFDEFSYVEAIGLYEFAYKRDTTDNYVVRRLADANRHIGNTEEVERWLKKLIDRRADQPEDLFNYSQALKSNGKYFVAEQWLQKYSELRPEDGRVNIQVSLLEYIKFLMRDSANYEIRNLAINTPGSEMGAAFYKGNLVFSSTSLGSNKKAKYNWNELPYLDMFSAKIEPNGELSSPESFAPGLKTSYHDGPVSFDLKRNVVYVTRDNFRKSKAAASQKGVVNLKIVEGAFENGNWKLKGDFRWDNDEYSVGHPAVSNDGNVIYFASDMPGGYGKSDLYFSVFSNGAWSKPINLGPKINTEGNEFFPFVSSDGVLYFASDGHGGLGGLDIFLSVPDHGVFNTIENLGYPVNSSLDDFAFALDSTGVRGYFTSNRLGGKGNDDLYSVKILHVPVIIRGVVKDRDTKDILSDAKVSVLDESEKVIFSSVTRVDGQFEVEVSKGQQYTVRVTKDSYNDGEKTIQTNTLRPNDEVFSEIFLEQKIEENASDSPAPISMEKEGGEDLQVIEIEYINYDLDKWNIRPDAAAVLDKLAEIVKKYPDLEIRIESYTDSQGSDEYNMLLSQKRARGAFDYLVTKGIDSKRMEYKGFGETHLLNKCANGVPCTEEEHEVNRRSIVKVVRKGEYKERRDQKNIFYF